MLERQTRSSNELLAYATGELRPPRGDRAIAKEARAIYQETRLVGLKGDAVLAIGARILEGAAALDRKRRSLSDGDGVMNSVLIEIEVQTITNALKLQTAFAERRAV